MALFTVLVGFGPLIAGFTNADLRERLAALLGVSYSARQATYDLRRLRRKGLIARLPGRHRYLVTPFGRRVAVLFVKTYGRVLTPGLSSLDPGVGADVASRDSLATAWRRFDQALDERIADGLIAA